MRIETKVGLFGCFIYFVMWTLIAFVGALCLDYDIKFWTKYSTGVEKHMPFYLAMLISYLPIVGQIAVPVAIFTFVFSFCI